MPSLTLLADAVAAEALTFADLLDHLDAADRTAPTPCAAWTIDDLAAHVASGAFRDAEAFHRARLGTSSPPAELAFSGDAASAIRLSIEHLRAALDHPPGRWPTIPMAFGPYPVDAALQSLVIEFGTHRNDLEIAMGESDDALARLMLRRLDVTDPQLTLDDPAHLAPALATAIRPL
jgi:uncharacterized protein (TIGR03083 family)